MLVCASGVQSQQPHLLLEIILQRCCRAGESLRCAWPSTKPLASGCVVRMLWWMLSPVHWPGVIVPRQSPLSTLLPATIKGLDECQLMS